MQTCFCIKAYSASGSLIIGFHTHAPVCPKVHVFHFEFYTRDLVCDFALFQVSSEILNKIPLIWNHSMGAWVSLVLLRHTLVKGSSHWWRSSINSWSMYTNSRISIERLPVSLFFHLQKPGYVIRYGCGRWQIGDSGESSPLLVWDNDHVFVRISQFIRFWTRVRFVILDFKAARLHCMHGSESRYVLCRKVSRLGESGVGPYGAVRVSLANSDVLPRQTLL
jgi:hypothetical protein